MNYSTEIVLSAIASGMAWEMCNHFQWFAAKIFMRGMSFMFASLCIGYIMLQYVALTKM